MKIKVEVKNELFGNSIFWEGDAKDSRKIHNLVARSLAKQVKEDGNSRNSGMWHVSRMKEENGI